MNGWAFFQWTATSILANIIVIGLLWGTLMITAAIICLVVNRSTAFRWFFYGIFLAAVMLFLSASEFQCVPVTFHGITRLGLATIPGNKVIDIINNVLSWLYLGISYLGVILLPLGFVMLIAKIDWGPKCIIVGAVMSVLAGLISGGSLFQILLSLMGTNVPLLA